MTDTEDLLAVAMKATVLELVEYTPGKKKCLNVAPDGMMSVETFAEKLKSRLGVGKQYKNHPEVHDAIHELPDLIKLIEIHARASGVVKSGKTKIIPPEFESYTLNLDLSSTQALKFFCTTPDEHISPLGGPAYMAVMGMKQEEAIAMARPVFPEYHPRGEPGVTSLRTGRKEVRHIFNTYVPPLWHGHPKFKTDSPKIHPLFLKLFKHVFPLKKDRTYFYAWMYMSLFKRSPTYLVLSGNPGIGKNRIKLLMRALHGSENTPDGKKSMLTERFNSQIDSTTLLWFDELKYEEQVQNILKEMQNETISIEKKGIDATRSTRIYASMVISNNEDRDNHIVFDGRKFVPLECNKHQLPTSMTTEEIDKLSRMCEKEESPDFDIEAIAEFAKWLKKYGPGYASKYPNMEYKGPKFWQLAHTTMSKWQGAIIGFLLTDKVKTARLAPDDEGFFKWSLFEPPIKRILGRNYNFPHHETIRKFLNIYRSLEGEKIFETKKMQGLESDFYLKFPTPKIERKGLIGEDLKL